MINEELEQLREDDGTYNDDVDSFVEQATHGTSSVLGKTTEITSYPTSAVCFYAVKITILMGDETENATPDYTASDNIIYAVNLGSQVPPVDTIVLCTYVPFRWVFAYDGP